ncbi:hypothetical protein PM082_000706 [Marasmius tenuissimus]|nr:hypothetical protein PM082_000706 [Marasmius tenuissimus]
MMMFYLMDGKPLNLGWAFILPPLVSICSMSSLLYIVYGTLGTYALLFDPDLEVVCWANGEYFSPEEITTLSNSIRRPRPQGHDVEKGIKQLEYCWSCKRNCGCKSNQ